MNDEIIVTTYASMVYRIAINYARNREDAEDIMSEAFLRYFRKARNFTEEEHRKAWLIKVTVNCAKTFLRKRKVHSSLDALPLPAAADDELADARLEVREALSALEPDDANIIYLFYYEDLKLAEIAAVLGISEGAAKMRLSRSRERLKKHLAAAE